MFPVSYLHQIIRFTCFTRSNSRHILWNGLQFFTYLRPKQNSIWDFNSTARGCSCPIELLVKWGKRNNIVALIIHDKGFSLKPKLVYVLASGPPPPYTYDYEMYSSSLHPPPYTPTQPQPTNCSPPPPYPGCTRKWFPTCCRARLSHVMVVDTPLACGKNGGDN